MISQNMLMVLSYGSETRLAVWKNIIVQVGGIQISTGHSLDEQIIIDEKRAKLQRKITRVEKAARNEKQPKKKLALVNEVKRMMRELEEL